MGFAYHACAKNQRGIRDSDLRYVGPGCGVGCGSDGFDASLKLLPVERGNGDLCASAFMHLSHLGLRDANLHFDRVQIDDGENRNTGRDRISDLELAHSDIA